MLEFAFLFWAIVGIVMAAVREACGSGIDTRVGAQRRRALIAGAAAFGLCAGCAVLASAQMVERGGGGLFGGDASQLRAASESCTGSHLDLLDSDPDPAAEGGWKVVENSDLLTDHGHLMHLYAVRWPEMDASVPPAPSAERQQRLQ